jgi:hypothetical protein
MHRICRVTDNKGTACLFCPERGQTVHLNGAVEGRWTFKYESLLTFLTGNATVQGSLRVVNGESGPVSGNPLNPYW